MDKQIPNKIRKKSCNMFNKYFDDSEISKHIDEGCYNYAMQYCKNNNYSENMIGSVYDDIVNNLKFNLDENNDSIISIKEQIISNKFNPHNLAYSKQYELNYDIWKKILSRKKKTEEKLNDLPSVTWHPCKLCKGTNYSFLQLQTRGADEPMTTYYTCKSKGCGKVYAINN